MAPRKGVARETRGPAVRINAPPAHPAAKLPYELRFALVVLMSFSISALLYSFQGTVMDYELAKISRRLDGWEHTGGVVAWKLAELGVSWYAGFDDLDAAALTILTHTPYLYLIYTFYGISLETTLSSLAIDTLSTWLPTRLLRTRSLTHTANAPLAAVPNRSLIHDTVIGTLTSLLGATIYSSVLFSALKTFLPTYLTLHFTPLPTLEPSHSATLPLLTATTLPLGWAIRAFVLDPSLGHEAVPTTKDAVAAAFNPATATLPQTLRHNLWGYDKRTKVLLRRLGVVLLMVPASTIVQVYGRVDGADIQGAVVYAGVWAAAGAVAAGVYEWVGRV